MKPPVIGPFPQGVCTSPQGDWSKCRELRDRDVGEGEGGGVRAGDETPGQDSQRDRERGEQPSQGGFLLQSTTTTRRMECFQTGAPPFAPRFGAIVKCWGLRQAAVSLPVSAKTAALLSEGLQEEDGPGVRSMLMEGRTLPSPVPALRVPPEEPGFQLSRGRLQLLA